MKLAIKREGLTLRGVLEGATSLENEQVVILMHGFQGNRGYEAGNLLYDLAHVLNAAGLATLRMDFAGCGQSDGDFANMTVLSELLDGMAMIDFVRAKMGVKVIDLVGHSQGGVVASMLAAYYQDVVDKLVLLAPAATLKDDALVGECQGTKYDPNHIPMKVTIHGQDVSGQYFRTAQLLPIYETAQHFAGPALIIHGLADKVVSPEASRKYNVILPESKLYLMEGTDHKLTGAKRGEILTTVTQFIKD